MTTPELNEAEDDATLRQDVYTANQAFYRAFRERDMAAMTAFWNHEDAYCCIHPGWPPIFGRDLIIKTWRDLLTNPQNSRVDCQNEVIEIRAGLAVVICIETIDGHPLAVTNMFRRNGDGRWLMTLHQASPIAAASFTENQRPKVLH